MTIRMSVSTLSLTSHTHTLIHRGLRRGGMVFNPLSYLLEASIRPGVVLSLRPFLEMARQLVGGGERYDLVVRPLLIAEGGEDHLFHLGAVIAVLSTPR